MDAVACSHLDRIAIIALPEAIRGCEDCLATGGRWVHLRMCQSCGKIGCCDSSPNRHARRHAGEAGHPIARSAEPGEDWSWCFVDEVAFIVDTGAAEADR
ncbi:MAG TPA: UBP-type zinc finger domain-containing protein [Gaiellaceae bacterium]|nr:UBP-type zinc finger domain-containing protein [Gaiellaceae bacterium]